jgi:hypothetical protein
MVDRPTVGGLYQRGADALRSSRAQLPAGLDAPRSSAMPKVTIQAPHPGFTVPAGQQLTVRGFATGTGGAEPVLIDSVTVAVDGGAAVGATLTVVAHQQLPRVRFTATVTVPDAPGSHTATAVALDDNGQHASASVAVLRDVTVAIPPPAILIDLEPPVPVPTEDPTVKALVICMQQALSAQATVLAGSGKLLAGPNVLATHDAAGVPILRLGIWLVDAAFPVVAPMPPQLPLPRLSDVQAEVGFALVGPLPRGHRTGVTDTPFGVRVPVSTLQSLIDIAVAQTGDDRVQSVSVAVTEPAGVTTVIRGRHLGIGFEIDVAETLSTAAVPGAEPPQSVPHVDAQHSSSLGLLEWLLGALLPILGGALVIGSVKLAEAADDVPGVVTALTAGLPARVPVRNTSLPPAAAGLFDFPQIVLDWTAFGVADGAVQGAGDALLDGRDQAGVQLSIGGPDSVQIPVGEFDVDLAYRLRLAGIRPDDDRVAWQLHTPFSATTDDTASSGALAEGAGIDVDFVLPPHATSGTFTITASAVETCATDATKTLSAATSVLVHVRRPAHAPV